MNCYKVLNINQNATKEDIKKAYRESALKYHPDKNQDLDTKQKFIEIQTAYEILYSDDKRKEYDKMSNEQKLHFYDSIKHYFSNISPKGANIYTSLINKYYGSEDDLRKDVNDLNIKKIYDKINNIYKQQIDEIKHTDHIKTTKIIVNTTFEDRYLNRYKKITINTETVVVPLRETELVYKDTYHITVQCTPNLTFRRINEIDLMTTKTISLYEYLYGGSVTIDLPKELYKHTFETCINQVPAFCIPDKGMPYLTKEKKEVSRGKLYVYLQVKDINCDLKDFSTIKAIIKKIFPPLNND